MTYLLARPALRKALGEDAPTAYETGLLASLRSRVEKREPANSQGLGVESILAARFLATTDAFDRMWALQLHDGAAKGAWNWFSLELDPWETPESRFYGAAMAAMSVPSKDHGRPEAQELIAYLTRERAQQPLHHRLMLIWASTRFPEVLPAAARTAIVDEAWKKQQADGSWTTEALGPFEIHPNGPHAQGSNAYATAFAAYVLQQIAGDASDPKLTRALAWLRTHQDAGCGCWQAVSMNKQFEPGSMQSKFMTDAATSFAVLALLSQKNASPGSPTAY
jgi:squalene-hopene/tetraprenyl-beta-curcumene cyclase